MSAAPSSLEVLVVDDIDASRQAVCELVEALGHRAVGAASGLAALQQVQRQPPDLVLLDLLMPGLDGFEVTGRIQALSPQRWLPVIVTSGLQGEEPFIRALEAGADDYLERPVNPALLGAKLRHYARVLELQSRSMRLVQLQRDTLDNILDPVITLGMDGRVEDFNQAAMALRDAQDRPLATGMGCASLFDRPLSELLECRALEVSRGGSDRFTAALGLSEWRERGRSHYTLVLRDLSEQQRIDRMKDEFLAAVSHELRTPLTAVLGSLSLLAAGKAGALPESARPLAEMARRNGQRLSRLIDDMLDLTKLEGGQLALQQRVQALGPLLQEALTTHRAYAEAADVRLQGLGLEATGLPEVRVDSERLQQVLANLLSNAVKHSPPGAVVELGLSASAQGCRIQVRDYGSGIAPGFQARMFEKFSQADGSDRRAKGGTGLGLYITRQFVERMGGRIWAEQPDGPGACFCVEFPAASAGAVREALLLHVSRDWSIRERLSRWLGPLWRVDSAADLDQARALVARERPALCIADPQAQGAADEFCLGLQSLLPGCPLLLLSDSVNAEFCRGLGLPWLPLSQVGEQALLAAIRQQMPEDGS